MKTVDQSQLEAMQERMASKSHRGPQGEVNTPNDDDLTLADRHALAFGLAEIGTEFSTVEPAPDPIVEAAAAALNAQIDAIVADNQPVEAAPPPDERLFLPDATSLWGDVDMLKYFPEDEPGAEYPDGELPDATRFNFLYHGKVFLAGYDKTPASMSSFASKSDVYIKVTWPNPPAEPAQTTMHEGQVPEDSGASTDVIQYVQIIRDGIQVQNSYYYDNAFAL